MNLTIKFHSMTAVPIVIILLLKTFISGLDSRPSNLTCLAEDVNPRVIVQNAFPGTRFQAPMVMRQNSSDATRIFVAEKAGVIQLLVKGAKQTEPFLDIRSKVSSGGERGLLGLAFHNDYDSNHYFYLSYTDLNGNSIISRYTRSTDNTDLADPDSETVILTLSQPYPNHNGGNINFGPDGLLYIGFGYGGSGGDHLNHGQDLSTWLGSMLRIDVDGGQPYIIPSDNPFSGESCNQSTRTGSCPEIYAYGLRNPWRWSFDAGTGELWLGDVGQNQVEEIDRVISGANLGWRCYEGTESYNLNGCDSITSTFPVTQYSHENGRCSVTGGYVYRGTGIAELEGVYLYGDYCTGEIWGLSLDEIPSATPELLTTATANIYSFAEDIQGEIYVLQSSGEIGRLEIDLSGGEPDPVPDLLTDTGCVDISNPTQPAEGLIPYDINAPFWSDGAQKTRWFALPDDSRIINANEEWTFPPGSVLIKNFTIAGKLIETRHLKHHPKGFWEGYTYEWNSAETEAVRVRDGKTVVVDNNDSTQNWVFPSQAECRACHTAAAGYVLGPETAQLNKDYYYATTGRTANQLSTASKIGLLENSLGSPPRNLPRLANPYEETDRLEQRARAWLQTNCSGCHRPGGSTNSAMDLRASTLLEETNSCRVPAVAVGPGWPHLLLSPGDASASLIYFRANSRDAVTQMPPLGSTVADTAGMAMIEEWLNDLLGCTTQ